MHYIFGHVLPAGFEFVFLLEAVGGFVTIDDPRARAGGVEHAVEKRRKKAVLNRRQLGSIAMALLHRQRVAKGQQDDRIGIGFLNRLHELPAARANLRAIVFE